MNPLLRPLAWVVSSLTWSSEYAWNPCLSMAGETDGPNGVWVEMAEDNHGRIVSDLFVRFIKLSRVNIACLPVDLVRPAPEIFFHLLP